MVVNLAADLAAHRSADRPPLGRTRHGDTHLRLLRPLRRRLGTRVHRGRKGRYGAASRAGGIDYHRRRRRRRLRAVGLHDGVDVDEEDGAGREAGRHRHGVRARVRPHDLGLGCGGEGNTPAARNVRGSQSLP
jgi:hypothetical protein